MVKEQFLIDVGNRIATLRKQLKLSQEDIAEMIDASKQTISIIESGKREMLAWNVVKIADALGVSTDYLLKGIRTDADCMAIDKRIRNLTVDQFNLVNDLLGRAIDYFENEQ